MDVTNLLNEDLEAKWYTVGDSDVRVKIRPLKPSRQDEIERVCSRRGKTDVRKQFWMMLDEAVVDWENIFVQDANGEQVRYQCSQENKRALDANWPDFRLLWLGVLGRDVDALRAAEEEELGN